MVLKGSLQRHRNVPIRNIYGPTASYILAFAECALMANSSRQRRHPITTGLHPKADIGRADVRYRGQSGRKYRNGKCPFLTHSGQCVGYFRLSSLSDQPFRTLRRQAESHQWD